jgi:hypothetical protein
VQDIGRCIWLLNCSVSLSDDLFVPLSVCLYTCNNLMTDRIAVKIYTGKSYEKLAGHFSFHLRGIILTTLHGDLRAFVWT